MSKHEMELDRIALPVDAAAQESREISVIDLLTVLARRKWPIASVTLLAAIATAIGVFLWPPSYTADAVILPPQQQQSSLSALASSALGGLAGLGMASQLGLKNPEDLYIGILKSRAIGDDIIQKFRLREVYGKKLDSDTRKALEKHTSITSGKDSLIKISVDDRDPKRAAGLANAYVDELYKQNSRLALTDASQRRLFFEQQLGKEKDALADAEIALKQTQQSTGLVVPAGQAEAIIRSAAQLRAQIASREVELEALRSYATDQNPQVQVLKTEIAAMRDQLRQLEAKGGSASGMAVSAGSLPEASLEYLRKFRDLKYHETLYELLAKQYEAARIDEARQAPLIQVVDRADVPDKKSWPPRGLMIVAAAVLAALAACAFALLSDAFSKSPQERFRPLREALHS